MKDISYETMKKELAAGEAGVVPASEVKWYALF
jgi:hypothetical protein